jgi:serine/threonine protein kinase
MGVVYKAQHLKLKRLVALKMILAGSHAGEDERKRFFSEAEAVARLQHPNIVQIYEVGEHDGRPFLALEYVDGASLARRVEENKLLPVRQAAELVEKLARAIHFAHEQKIIHRDLKPANILLTAAGEPKITDFGLAKQLDDDSGRTRTGAVMGTPSYMAPEQAEGKIRDIGPWTDVYALGVVLFELLTGQTPFAGPPAIILFNVMHKEPPSLRGLNSLVPKNLETICLRCLEKDPTHRFSSAEALSADLQRYLRREPIKSRSKRIRSGIWRWCKNHPVMTTFIFSFIFSFSWAIPKALKAYYDTVEAMKVRPSWALGNNQWNLLDHMARSLFPYLIGALLGSLCNASWICSLAWIIAGGKGHARQEKETAEAQAAYAEEKARRAEARARKAEARLKRLEKRVNRAEPERGYRPEDKKPRAD